MVISGNSRGIRPGYAEGENAELAEKEPHQEIFEILEHNFFGMEGKDEKGRKYLMG